MKYATTGDLPPNSKNGAFIHDPKIGKQTETKAQVKLRFRNLNGEEMVCTRSMSLTQKRNTRTQKTLECLLMTKNQHGDQVSVSSRCAELDAEIPNQLGVSKAILENVIFCHQEESFWPLSEPAVLKKKFDEIFAATKYTKALDNIKSLRKEQAVTLKLEQQHLDHLKSDRERAQKIKVFRETVEVKVAAKKSLIEDIQTRTMSRIQEQIDTATANHQAVHDSQMKLEQLEHEKDILVRNMNQMKQTLVEYDETDDRLQEILSDYLQSAENRKSESDRLIYEKEQLTADVDSLSRQHSDMRSKQGALAAKREVISFIF